MHEITLITYVVCRNQAQMLSLEPCAHCGSLPTVDHPLSPQWTISQLTRHIQQLDDSIRHLKERKAAASAQLNAMRASTGVVPDEVLAIIFKFATSPHDTPVNTSGEVPTFTDFFMDKRKQYFFFPCPWRSLTYPGPWKHDVSLPHSYFVNSSNQPMEVGARIEHNPLAVQLKRLRDLLFLEYPHRITHLKLTSPPPVWLPHFSESFSALKRLEPSWLSSKSFSPSRRTSIQSLPPSLQQVVLTKVTVNMILPWKTITSLRPQTIPPDLSAPAVNWPLPNEIISLPKLEKSSTGGYTEQRRELTAFLSRLPISQVHFNLFELGRSDRGTSFVFNFQYTPVSCSLLDVIPRLGKQLSLIDRDDPQLPQQTLRPGSRISYLMERSKWMRKQMLLPDLEVLSFRQNLP
ncbi:hypothetical protein NP233_g7728 [Leucocoprinus birnbaumii]|uniref:Uncharacterized protein n=1 Tax=Leucocoprinus birnbaumii TaxID=56174 RepID=A0AAD5YSH8_9AGAR|nr:hypothetical protein NP233_g7728 [Leucocoprinus birnbaumii]